MPNILPELSRRPQVAFSSGKRPSQNGCTTRPFVQRCRRQSSHGGEAHLWLGWRLLERDSPSRMPILGALFDSPRLISSPSMRIFLSARRPNLVVGAGNLRRATFFARGASPSSSSSSPSWLRGLSRRTRHHSSSAETRNLVGTGVSTPSAIHANATNALPSARLRLPRTPSTRADGVRGHDKCIRTLSSTCHFAHARPGPPEARQTALRSRCSSAPG